MHDDTPATWWDGLAVALAWVAALAVVWMLAAVAD